MKHQSDCPGQVGEISCCLSSLPVAQAHPRRCGWSLSILVVCGPGWWFAGACACVLGTFSFCALLDVMTLGWCASMITSSGTTRQQCRGCRRQASVRPRPVAPQGDAAPPRAPDAADARSVMQPGSANTRTAPCDALAFSFAPQELHFLRSPDEIDFAL